MAHAPQIPNLLTSRANGPGRVRRGGFRGVGSGAEDGGEDPAAARARKDTIVQGTDTDANISRMSAVSVGYLDDPFAKEFATSNTQRRFPIINRGTFPSKNAHSPPLSPPNASSRPEPAYGIDIADHRVLQNQGPSSAHAPSTSSSKNSSTPPPPPGTRSSPSAPAPTPASSASHPSPTPPTSSTTSSTSPSTPPPKSPPSTTPPPSANSSATLYSIWRQIRNSMPRITISTPWICGRWIGSGCGDGVVVMEGGRGERANWDISTLRFQRC
jgi:hypothetical protein